MRKIAFSFMVFLFLFFAFCKPVYAVDIEADAADAWEKYGMGEVAEGLDHLIPDYDLDMWEIWGKILQGKITEAAMLLWEGIKGKLLSELAGMKNIFASILILGIISALFANFSDVFQNHQIADISFYFLYLLLMSILMKAFLTAADIAGQTVENIVLFIKMFIPSMPFPDNIHRQQQQRYIPFPVVYATTAMVIINKATAVNAALKSSRLPSPTRSVQPVILLSLTIPTNAALPFIIQAIRKSFAKGIRQIANRSKSIKTPMLFLISTAEPITISVTPSAKFPMPGMAPTAFLTAETLRESSTGAIIDWNRLKDVMAPIATFSPAPMPFFKKSSRSANRSSAQIPFSKASNT